MSDYYDELYDSELTHVKAGWRHPFEQTMRFAMACELPQLPRGGALLDVGCGPGGLFGYLVESEWLSGDGDDRPEALYRGVDRLEEAIALARSLYPGATFVCEDVMSSAQTCHAETVMAIGAMISGEPCENSARFERVQQFVTRCVSRSTCQGAVVMLDQGELEARASLSLEHALFGVRRGEELDALVDSLTQRFDVDVSVHPEGFRSDVTLYWQRRDAGCAPLTLRTNEAIAAQVLARVDPHGAQLYWRGWLYAELGMWEAAHTTLRECLSGGDMDGTRHRRARILLERLALFT